jgi:hypothetical protein
MLNLKFLLKADILFIDARKVFQDYFLPIFANSSSFKRINGAQMSDKEVPLFTESWQGLLVSDR